MQDSRHLSKTVNRSCVKARAPTRRSLLAWYDIWYHEKWHSTQSLVAMATREHAESYWYSRFKELNTFWHPRSTQAPRLKKANPVTWICRGIDFQAPIFTMFVVRRVNLKFHADVWHRFGRANYLAAVLYLDLLGLICQTQGRNANNIETFMWILGLT